MRKLDAIRERLRRYTSADTDTDEKLVEGISLGTTLSSDLDMAWLLARVAELDSVLWDILYVDHYNAISAGLHKRAKFALDNAREHEFTEQEEA